MKQRRVFAAALALVLLAGCGGQGSTPSPSVLPTPAVSQSPTPSVTPTPEVYESLTLKREEFPRLDGSTSTAPLARAVCAVLLGEEREEVNDLVQFSRTTQSYRMLMSGFRDLLIAAEPAETVLKEKEEAKFEWEMAPIATDALVFLVNEDNPVDNLTIEQVQKIYTGEITNWKEVGGEDRPILPFQRNAEAGSQTLMQKLVMGDIEMMEPEKEYLVDSMAGLIEAVRSFDGSPGAIGYTVYYYANDMNMAEGLKVVSIGGAAPDAATIRSGDYPFTNPYYTTIAADAPEDSPARKVFDWLQGPIGQSLIQHEGYVSILDDPAPIEWDLGETEPLTEIYTRLSEEPMPELIPSDNYGSLLSYVGYTIDSEWGGYYNKYGLITREGMMVTDPVYNSVGWVSYYDGTGSQNLDILRLTRTMGETEEEMDEYVALAAEDGSWVTGFDWLYVEAVSPDRLWAVLPNGDGVMMDLTLKELWRLPLEEGEERWQYQGGMSGAMWWNNGTGIYYDTDGVVVIDLEGNVIAGQENGITGVQGFREGLAMAQKEDDWSHWGYINKAGEWVIEPRFEQGWDFHDGKAMVKENGVHKIIDTEGNVLLEALGFLLRGESDQGDWYLDYGEVQYAAGGGGYWIGAVYDENLQPLEWNWIEETVDWGGNRYMYRRTETGIEMGNPYENILLPVEQHTNFHFYDSEIIILTREIPGGEGRRMWSAWGVDGTCILPEEECEYISIIADNETGETYLIAEKNGKCFIYDAGGNYLTDCAGWPMISDGLISMQTELSQGYKTLDGEWVFRISLMKSQED